MSEPKKFYKVCKVNRTDKNIITSLRLSSRATTVLYNLNQWVYSDRPGKFLFVFDGLDKAINFAKCIDNTTIYECEVEGLEYNPEFAYGPNREKKTWPDGTAFAYGVKLIREIEIEQEMILSVGDIIKVDWNDSSDSSVGILLVEEGVYVLRNTRGGRILDKCFRELKLEAIKEICGSHIKNVERLGKCTGFTYH